MSTGSVQQGYTLGSGLDQISWREVEGNNMSDSNNNEKEPDSSEDALQGCFWYQSGVPA